MMKSCFPLSRDKIVTTIAALVLLSSAFRFLHQNQHQLIAVGTMIDLGRVSVGQTKEKVFSVSNSSSRAMEILQWAPTCRCMQARFGQTIVAPHTDVEAFIRTTAARPLGMRAASIAVRWRYVGEQGFRTDNLLVKARYISNFSLSEEIFDFGDVSNNEMPAHLISLRPESDGNKWDGLEVTADSKSLSVNVLKQVGNFNILAKLDSKSIPSGVWKDTIRIFTLLKGVRTGDELDIPVVAKIKGQIRASPSVIQLSASSLPQFFSLKIHSAVDPIRGLKFVGDFVLRPNVTILEGGKDAIMTGFLPAPTRGGVYVGKIPIQVNNDPLQQIQVSFLGFAIK